MLGLKDPADNNGLDQSGHHGEVAGERLQTYLTRSHSPASGDISTDEGKVGVLIEAPLRF